MNKNMPRLHRLAEKITETVAGPRPELAPEDHVRNAVEWTLRQKRIIEELQAELDELKLHCAKLSTELDGNIHRLNAATRERDHYMSYAYTLTAQLNSIQAVIADALDVARRMPARQPPAAPAAAEDKADASDDSGRVISPDDSELPTAEDVRGILRS